MILSFSNFPFMARQFSKRIVPYSWVEKDGLRTYEKIEDILIERQIELVLAGSNGSRDFCIIAVG
jgi:hypothetical protein